MIRSQRTTLPETDELLAELERRWRAGGTDTDFFQRLYQTLRRLDEGMAAVGDSRTTGYETAEDEVNQTNNVVIWDVDRLAATLSDLEVPILPAKKRRTPQGSAADGDQTFAELAAGDRLRTEDPWEAYLFSWHRAAVERNATRTAAPGRGPLRTISGDSSDFEYRGQPWMRFSASTGRQKGERRAAMKDVPPAEIAAFRRAVDGFEDIIRERLKAVSFECGTFTAATDELNPENSSFSFAVDYSPWTMYDAMVESNDNLDKLNTEWDWLGTRAVLTFMDRLMDEGFWIPWGIVKQTNYGLLRVNRHPKRFVEEARNAERVAAGLEP